MKLPEWLHPAYARVEELERHGRMPHALLLCGPLGIGLEYLADAIAVRALDEPAADFPELRLPVLAHADLRLVQPEDGRSSLTVETIREIDAWLHLTPQFVAGKVVVIGDAHLMTRAAGNALLKTLEEPPLGSLLILFTHAPSRLLPTIRSRAQRIDVSRPSSAKSVAWIASRHAGVEEGVIKSYLFESGGTPLAADQALFKGTPLLGPLLIEALKRGSAIKLVDRLCELNAEVWLGVWMRYCVLALSPAPDEPPRMFPENLDFRPIWAFWQRLLEVRRMLHTGVAINAKLTAENLVSEWSRLADSRTGL